MVLEGNSAEVAEVLPNSTLNHFATASASDKAFLEGGVPAERGVGAALDHSVQPVNRPMVAAGLTSPKEELNLGEIWNLS